ncbi:MAG TPA: DUF5343 domain-containing protein [Longimicrobium sp.]|jgi:hypothetical protein
MPQSYPYIISNNKIEPILAKIRSAAKPERFSREFLKKMGFTASNDRAMVTVMRDLGFVGETGSPTEYYDRLRDATDWKVVLGERVKDLYSDLYALNTEIHNATDDEIKGAISRITGKDERSVARYLTTFKTLASLANFSGRPSKSKPHVEVQEVDVQPPPQRATPHEPPAGAREPSFHYNIQIHLPATTDISVYNAIFKSMKEHLAHIAL